jgi:hypothetical protein
MNRASSRNAYRRIHTDGTAERTTVIILDYVEAHPGCTRREIEDGTGLRSAQVSGRVNEMLHDKRIEEYGYNYAGSNMLWIYGQVDYFYDQPNLPLE